MDEHDAGTGQAHEADCAVCANNIDFELPEAIVRAAKHGGLTIFAGAGVSTESRLVYPTTLYEELKSVLEWDPEDNPSFPRVMSAYEERFGRRQLISEIAERLEYVESFPFITAAASRFHRELSTISHINKIITTNWDTAFEDYCQARPFVVDEDYAYYDLPGRRVFKIHGSIRNVSSLIATDEDYLRREQEFQTSAMGSSLKHFLATEVVVFIGFSLSDPDFQSVYRGLLAGLARSRPPAYLVTPFPTQRAEEFGLKLIRTDGTHFLHALKRRLVNDDFLFPDSVLTRVEALNYRTREARRIIERSAWRTNAALYYSLAYLDGIDDATGRSLARAASGEVMEKNHLAHIIKTYDRLLQKAIDLERWWDAAYVDGYRIALYSFFMEDQDVREIELFESFDSNDYPGVERTDDQEQRDGDGGVMPDKSESRLLPPLPDPDDVISRFDASETSALPSINGAFTQTIGAMPKTGIPRHTPFLDGLIDDDEPLPTI